MEFLPESAGGKLPSGVQGDGKREITEEEEGGESAEEIEDWWCAEFEDCVKEEMQEEQESGIQEKETDKTSPARPSSITEADLFGPDEPDLDYEELEANDKPARPKSDHPDEPQIQQEAEGTEVEYHPQDPHPGPPPKRWWEREEEAVWKVMVHNYYVYCLGLDCSEGPKTCGLAQTGGWTGVSKDEVDACLNAGGDTYKPGNLQALSLAGCHWSSVEALKTCPGSLIELDLRWVQGCTDSNFKRLVADSPRLKQLECLFLSGCDVGDATARLIANQFPRIRWLDFSYCAKISNLSLEVLCAAGSVARRTLRNLNLAGCTLLEAEIFGHLQKMQTLNHLDLRACPNLTERECLEFETACRTLGKNLTVMC